MNPLAPSTRQCESGSTAELEAPLLVDHPQQSANLHIILMLDDEYGLLFEDEATLTDAIRMLRILLGDEPQ